MSKEKTMKGKLLYSPKDLNSVMKAEFEKKKWEEKRYTYYVTSDENVTRDIVSLKPEAQKQILLDGGHECISSYHQTDFVKNRIVIEVQLAKYSFIEFDLFVKHLGFFVGNDIDLGIEIVPTKKLQSEMSSGPGYYERVLTHILRHGRGNPPVPLILIGVEP